jgi:hypothetical protein
VSFKTDSAALLQACMKCLKSRYNGLFQPPFEPSSTQHLVRGSPYRAAGEDMIFGGELRSDPTSRTD